MDPLTHAVPTLDEGTVEEHATVPELVTQVHIPKVLRRGHAKAALSPSNLGVCV